MIREVDFQTLRYNIQNNWVRGSFFPCWVARFQIPSYTADPQLAHDVVTTLGFGCVLVATSNNIVTTLLQDSVSTVVTTTKN